MALARRPGGDGSNRAAGLSNSPDTGIEEITGVGDRFRAQTTRTGLRDNESTLGVTRRVTLYGYTQMFVIGPDAIC
jgi:hypothetical protein